MWHRGNVFSTSERQCETHKPIFCMMIITEEPLIPLQIYEFVGCSDAQGELHITFFIMPLNLRVVAYWMYIFYSGNASELATW